MFMAYTTNFGDPLCSWVKKYPAEDNLSCSNLLRTIEPRHEKTCPGFSTRVDSNRPAKLQKLTRMSERLMLSAVF